MMSEISELEKSITADAAESFQPQSPKITGPQVGYTFYTYVFDACIPVIYHLLCESAQRLRKHVLHAPKCNLM